MICKQILFKTFLDEPELFFFFAYEYCYLTLIILFNMIHLFVHSQMIPSIAILY